MLENKSFNFFKFTFIGCVIFFPFESAHPSVLPHMLHTQHHSLPHTPAHDLGRSIGVNLSGQQGMTMPSGSLFLELQVSFRGEMSLPNWDPSFSSLFPAPWLRDSQLLLWYRALVFKAEKGIVVSLDLSTYILIGYLEDVEEESLICYE